MSIINKLAKFGIAKKIVDEAQKPQNQQKAKDLFAKAQMKMNQRKNRPTT